jgi:ParB-like chromosome segregation protein Spo0J
LRNAVVKKKGSGTRSSLFVPQSVQIALSKIQLAPYNPRHITPEKRAALRASVLKHGMVENLVVQKRSKELGLDLVLIGGHQRLDAVNTICVENGWDMPSELPCVVLDIDDATAKQLNVALNNIGGEFDPFRLGEIFASILPNMTTQDVLATGFQSDELAELVRLTNPIDVQAAELEAGIGELGGFGKSITLSVEFDTTEERDRVKEQLRDLAKERGVKAGRLISEAVRGMTVMKKPGARAKAS